MRHSLIFKLLAFSLLTAGTSIVKAQDTTVYEKPQKRADYPGGLERFYVYLANNIKYRDMEIERDQSRIGVSFIVETDGSISHVNAGHRIADSLRQEAIRIVSTAPKWQPAYNDGKPVRSSLTIVITFGKGELHDSYSDEIYTTVWYNPRFFGGQKAFDKFIADNLKYPQADKDNKLSGVVTVDFIVEKDGRLTDIKATNGPTEAMKKEAVRVMSLSPTWFPGIWEGNKFVRVQFSAEVPFTL